MYEVDDGYFFGIGAFETIKISNKVPLLLEQHLNRLKTTLRFLGITKIITQNDIIDYIKANDILDGVLKVTVSDKNKGFLFRENPYSEADYQNGFKLMTNQNNLRSPATSLIYHKTFNYSENILAKKEALARGYDECLFINIYGEICEGSSSNIFFVRDKKIYGPKSSCGLLPGIVREFLCKNEEVTLTAIQEKDICDYDECFLTNSIMGIMPVRQLDQFTFSSKEYTNQLREEYAAFF